MDRQPMRDDSVALAYACQRVVISAEGVGSAFAHLRRYAYTPDPDPALTARPVQGSHRFMRDREPQLYQPPEIPAADPDAGYKIRIDRALDELVAALTVIPAPKLTADQHERIRKLAALSGE